MTIYGESFNNIQDKQPRTIYSESHRTTKVRKWGNSLAVRLPKALAEESRLREGSEVSFKVQGADIVISSSIKPRYTLEELAKGITKKNRHKEIDWGAARGKEI